jgi:hypothetical protein
MGRGADVSHRYERKFGADGKLTQQSLDNIHHECYGNHVLRDAGNIVGTTLGHAVTYGAIGSVLGEPGIGAGLVIGGLEGLAKSTALANNGAYTAQCEANKIEIAYKKHREKG